MPVPRTDPETRVEALVPALPPETAHRVRAFHAVVRAKQGKTPAPRVRVVFVAGGLAKALRAVAGTGTALGEALTAQSVAERWRACGPWGQALRRRRRPLSPVGTLPAG